jgi:signal transduction histidine kinase
VIHPEDRQSSLKQGPSLGENGQDPVRLEKRFLHKSGEVVGATTALATICNAAGRPAFLLMTIADLSREKKAEEECARLRKQLDRAQKMEAVGTLAGGLAHDFNNSLGVILGFASLARERLRPEDPLQETLRMIEESARGAGELTQQLLGTMREGRRERVRVNVKEVLGRVVKIASHTFDRRIRVETRLAPELPTVEAEAGQLEQALLNLCINARDAMPEGGRVTLETSTRPARCPTARQRAPRSGPGPGSSSGNRGLRRSP